MPELSWRREPRRIIFQAAILAPAPAANLTSLAATALLDTGATTSGVKREIASRLRLPELGKRPLGSAHGEAQVERFLFRIGFQVEGAQLPFVFEEVSGFELKDGLAFDALIGMDVLNRCDFSMERTGRCRLRFG
jgi:predicted aspartyl protease